MNKLNYVARNYYLDSPGGCEKVFYELYKRAREDYGVNIISSYEDESKFPMNSLIFPKKFEDNKLLRYAYYAFNLTKKSLKMECDLIHANNLECIRLSDKPFILNVHHVSHFLNEDVREQTLLTKLMRNVVAWQCNRASKVITVSHKTRNNLLKLGVEEEKIKVIHNGVDLDTFKPLEDGKEKDEFVITHASRISAGKGQNFSVNALSKLPESIKEDIELHIVGYVSDEEFYKTLPKKNWIKYYTNLEEGEFADKIAESDLVIFPTFMSEGFGLVVLEGMACGVPVIASDQEGIREAGGEACKYFTQGNEEEFLKLVKELYNDGELREKMKSKGLKRVENFTWDEVYKEYERVYNKLLRE